MRIKTLVMSVALILGACSSNPKTASVESGPVTALNNQQLTSTFKRQGIKLEWSCSYFTGFSDFTCIKNELKSIEVVGYAPSFGASEVMRENAFKVAHDQALDKLIRFVKQDISSTRVTNTISKAVEKAEDNIKRKIKRDEEFEVTDDEAMKDTNIAVRSNITNTTRNLQEIVRTNANGIIKGAFVKEEKIVGPQTVSVTVRWDQDSDRAAKYLGNKFLPRQ